MVWAENLWYSHHQPPVGGTPLKGAIPPPPSLAPTSSSPSAQLPSHLPVPPAIRPLASPAIPGEGVWHPVGRKVDGLPAVYEAYLRPDPVHTSLVVGVAWMDTKLLKATLYSGSTIPGGGPYPNTAPIEPDAAKSLVAAFNAGFLMSNANGGYYTDGQVIVPLQTGAASLVIYRNGTATIADWGRDATLTSNVVAVRQNLDLLVDPWPARSRPERERHHSMGLHARQPDLRLAFRHRCHERRCTRLCGRTGAEHHDAREPARTRRRSASHGA